MAAPTPQTKLDAVNAMLGTVWEAPVSSLNVTGVASVAKAVAVLDSTLRSVLTRGWAFNVEYNYPLALDVNSKVPLPANTLAVDTMGDSQLIDAVQRGSFLYDRGNHTFTFDSGPIYVRIVLGVAFEDLPETAKEYVSILAARRFKAEYLGQSEGDPTSAEIEALRNMEDAEADAGDHNVFTGSWSVARVLYR